MSANLPSIAQAKLPKSYEAAKTALAKCDRVDECKDWKDKAAALASYAKQSKDESLHKMAVRIQARAIQRCGQLLNKIEKTQGGRPKTGASLTPVSRKQAARDAGLSEYERNTALRVANIPDDQFDLQVEGEQPPTIGQLAAQGTVAKVPNYLGERTPEEFQAATALLGFIDYIVRGADRLDLPVAMRGLSRKERLEMHARIARARSYLQTIEEKLLQGVDDEQTRTAETEYRASHA
jgi:hypothetical protein